ncbi:MAG: alpha/beta fold hydrolase [Candidatus Heimdallarchaeota archaeon]|nr:alpha/beta fold hydrolase [Candidatus Heimdallarchaeota archaeon]
MKDQTLNNPNTKDETKKYFDFKFPIGLQDFHPAKYLLAFNFQLNRYYTLGWLEPELLKQVSSNIEDFNSWKQEMNRFAEQAEAKKQFKEACILYRAAEFYTNPADQDKENFYNKFLDLFDVTFQTEPFERLEVPYKDGFLSVMHLTPANENKGVILFHGGFDSFIEELYPIATFFANIGYEIFMFEGPGQGRPLHHYNLKMDPHWETPTKAILDYFNLNEVTLIGMSLGGFLAPRAAAFEPRVARVVLWGVIYDLIGQNKLSTRLLLKILFKFKAKSKTNRLFNRIINKRSPSDPKRIHSEWFFSHALFNTGCESVYDYLKEASENYTTKNISHLIKQDVLILIGEDDIDGKARFFYKKQVEALKNAKSITGRIFTKEDNASHHCQAGNVGLALDYIQNWLNQFSTKIEKR